VTLAALQGKTMNNCLLPRRSLLIVGSSLGLSAALGACSSMGAGTGWTTLVDGTSLKSVSDLAGWTQAGTGNWSVTEGTLQGKGGTMGYLVTPQSYGDFELQAEFWADEPANSGIFIRCQDRNTITPANSYEVNIFDKRPDPTYGTGAIVDVAKVAAPYPQAANKWNTFYVTAKGDQLVVVFNGQKTVDVRDGKHKSGPIALQSAGGTIRFRKVQIRAI
jgi:hypothetical protein